MKQLNNSEIRDAVRENYANVAVSDSPGCGGSSGGCCSGQTAAGAADISMALGYSAEDLSTVPEGANMGLGCGNPQAIAELKPGETVLDLGSGGGFDCFLAARAVGESGRVIGVDMTPEMVLKARHNAGAYDMHTVEFRLGEIEHLPVADNSIDVIISNCVINLSPEKEQVFREAFRVLKPGGRLAISDVVATAALPAETRQDMALYSGCVGGASAIPELKEMLARAGFADIRIQAKDESKTVISEWVPGRNIADYIVSAGIEGRKAGEE